jgi:dipeptidyl aminopeptidase/acylaminoacyl peptidase
MLCPSCGQENREGAQFCAGCGADLGAAPPAEASAKPDLVETLKKHKFAIAGGAGGVLVLCLLAACVVVIVSLVLSGLTGDSEILVGFPDRDGELDLYVLKAGQPEEKWSLVAENADLTFVSMLLLEDELYYGGVAGFYGGFVPDSDHVLLWYELDGELTVQHMRVGGDEPTDVLNAGSNRLWGYFVKGPDLLLLHEDASGTERCYVAKLGEEAERLARGDNCDFSRDGSTVVLLDRSRQDETTLSVVDVKTRKEQVLLDQVEGFRSYQLSPDASHLAYLQEDRGDFQLHLVERKSDKETEVGGEVFQVGQYGFAPHSDTLYYVVREDGDDEDVRVYTSVESDRPVAEGRTIDVGFSTDGQHMIYVVEDKRGDKTLYVHPMKRGEDVEVVDGEDIEFGIFRTEPSRLIALVTDGDKVSLFSAKPDGRDLVELMTEKDVSLDHIGFVQGKSALYAMMSDEDGEILFVTPVDKATGFRLFEGWADIALLDLSPNGRMLVLAAVEDPGDDPVLYSIEIEQGAKPVALDKDADGFVNAVFTADGRYVIYSAITGTDMNDREVRQVRLDGKDKYEVLYEKAVIVDVRWDDLSPFWYFTR